MKADGTIGHLVVRIFPPNPHRILYTTRLLISSNGFAFRYCEKNERRLLAHLGCKRTDQIASDADSVRNAEWQQNRDPGAERPRGNQAAVHAPHIVLQTRRNGKKVSLV